MEKTEAIGVMSEHARDLIAKAKAEEIAQAFGHKLPKKLVRVWDMRKQRVTINTPDGRCEAVGVSELAVWLVEQEGKQPVRHSPFIGTGRTAEYITEQNVAILSGAKAPSPFESE